MQTISQLNHYSTGNVYNLGIFLMNFFAISLSISIHEFCHALVAYKLGDDTAKMNGRLTISPFSHFDTIGLISLFLFRFGWARPVPVNPMNFKRNIKRGLILTSFAGPIANFLLALTSFLILKIINPLQIENINSIRKIFDSIKKVLFFLGCININLAIFNLIPIPPLDGGKILMTNLPLTIQKRFLFIERYGYLLLFLLLQFRPFINTLNIVTETVYKIITNNILAF